MKLEFEIDEEHHGLTLLQFLKRKLGISKRFLRKLKAENRILNNGAVYRVSYPVQLGDKIVLEMDSLDDPTPIPPSYMPLEILYEDDHLIAINKEAGIVVHPDANHQDGTLANGLLHYYQRHSLNIKVRPISRLDRDTSGVILFAKNSMIQDCFIKQMRTGKFLKEYLGVVHGVPRDKTGTINLPISRKEGSTIERIISEIGALSVTHYKCLKSFKDYSILKFNLETGRTHQIRLHTKSIGHPLVGDTIYGSPSTLIFRQALHSIKASFIHPITQEPCTIHAKLPEDLRILIARIKT